MLHVVMHKYRAISQSPEDDLRTLLAGFVQTFVGGLILFQLEELAILEVIPCVLISKCQERRHYNSCLPNRETLSLAKGHQRGCRTSKTSL